VLTLRRLWCAHPAPPWLPHPSMSAPRLLLSQGDYEYYLSKNDEEAAKMEVKEERQKQVCSSTQRCAPHPDMLCMCSVRCASWLCRVARNSRRTGGVGCGGRCSAAPGGSEH